MGGSNFVLGTIIYKASFFPWTIELGYLADPTIMALHVYNFRSVKEKKSADLTYCLNTVTPPSINSHLNQEQYTGWRPVEFLYWIYRDYKLTYLYV